MRVDKWIWVVRMVKTRSIGTERCKAGHVLVNGDRTKPARELRAGDVVEVKFPGFSKVYRVVGFNEQRLGAKAAAELYEDLSPERPPQLAPPPHRDKGTGRPTKRERRALDKLRFD